MEGETIPGLAQLGVYAVTVTILLLILWRLWDYVQKKEASDKAERLQREKEAKEEQAKRDAARDLREQQYQAVIDNNTEAFKDNKRTNEVLITRFNDFVRNGGK